MSTSILPPTDSAAIDTKLESQESSFRQLVRRLDSLKRAPTFQEINDYLSEVKIDASELSEYLGFKMATYARHRVFRNDFAELLVLCWKPGQRTPIHDHNGSFGAVRVCTGVMWETIFSLDAEGRLCYQSARDWLPANVTGADVPDIHQLGNPDVSGQDLITLHLYAPPLGVLNTYRVGSSEVGHYTVDEFMDGAGI